MSRTRVRLGVDRLAGMAAALLLVTAALPAAAQDVELSLGGYMNNVLGFGNQPSSEEQDTRTLDAGLGFTDGPWSFSAGYGKGEMRLSPFFTNGEDVEALSGGAAVELAPGIKARATVLYTESEIDKGGEERGLLGVLGINLSF